MIEQITVNPINESLFSIDFIKGFRCGAKRQFQADVEKIAKAKFGRPTGEWVLEEYKSHNHIENFYICSSCRNFEAWGKTELYNYCPNCGAKMGGEK